MAVQFMYPRFPRWRDKRSAYCRFVWNWVSNFAWNAPEHWSFRARFQLISNRNDLVVSFEIEFQTSRETPQNIGRFALVFISFQIETTIRHANIPDAENICRGVGRGSRCFRFRAPV